MAKKDQELPAQPDSGAAPSEGVARVGDLVTGDLLAAAATSGLVAEPAPALVSPAPETKTPAEWAAHFGHTKERDRRLPQSLDHVDPAFAVADRLYGWSQRAYDYQAPEDRFLLTAAVYLAAVRSAPQFPAVELVADALTPERAEALKDHKPARNLKVERAEAEAKAVAQKGNG